MMHLIFAFKNSGGFGLGLTKARKSRFELTVRRATDQSPPWTLASIAVLRAERGFAVIVICISRNLRGADWSERGRI